ncbi:MAG: glycosyltransferase family 4 protein [Candidatus Micrarchaeia archaeon]
MEICVLNPFFYPYKGGTEKVIYEVYRRLAKRHNITVITSDFGSRPGIEYIEDIKVVRIKPRMLSIPHGPLPLLLFDGINMAIKEANADIYHINNRYQYFYDNIKTIKGMGKKLVLTIHNSLPRNIEFATDFFGLAYDIVWGRKLMHQADLITGVSNAAILETVPKKELGKAVTIYNGVDYKLFRKMKIEKSKGEIVLNNGRLVPQKGQEYLLKACAKLSKSTDATLAIIGKGPLKDKLIQMSYKLGMEKRLLIIEGIKESVLPVVYNMADVFVMPSLYEPAGLALMEAMACEVPSIATRIGGMPETLQDAGLYIKERDPESIYRAIIYAIENKKELEKKSRKGRKLIVKYHDWNKISKIYESKFMDLIKK